MMLATGLELQDIVRRYNADRPETLRSHLCHAPMHSIYFGRDGYASACCGNRTSSHGRYPQQSVDEIWFGVQRLAMVTATGPDRLPGGCQMCVRSLAAGNDSNTLARMFDGLADATSAANTNHYPRQMEFELSNICNLECVMCTGQFSSLIRKNRDLLPPLVDVYDDTFVEQLLPYLPFLKAAKFYGGEPFAVPIYDKIWTQMMAINPDIELTITTNGTVLNGRVERLLEAMNINLVVSIDSLDRATYGAIRVNADFDRTMAHIERFAELVERRGRRLTLVACPMSVNAHEMPALVDLCNRRGFHIGFNTVSDPSALTLRALPQERLVALMALYDAWTAPAGDPLQEDNRRRFDGLRAAVRALHADNCQPPGDAGVLEAEIRRRSVWMLHRFNRADRPPAYTLNDLVARLICDRYRPSGADTQAAIKVHLEGLGDRKEGLLAYAQACIAVVAEVEVWSPEMTERAGRQMWVMYERMGDLATIDHTLGLDPRLIADSLVSA